VEIYPRLAIVTNLSFGFSTRIEMLPYQSSEQRSIYHKLLLYMNYFCHSQRIRIPTEPSCGNKKKKMLQAAVYSSSQGWMQKM